MNGHNTSRVMVSVLIVLDVILEGRNLFRVSFFEVVSILIVLDVILEVPLNMFRQANFNDWGFGDYDDIMGGVDKLIADGIAHPDSLCVTGWSYGGYMTSMIITKTNRFKASMVGAGVTNLISFNGTADIAGFLPDYFGGEFWDRTDVYMKHSAMFGVKNVKTPTLIIHGEKDLRVPI